MTARSVESAQSYASHHPTAGGRLDHHAAVRGHHDGAQRRGHLSRCRSAWDWRTSSRRQVPRRQRSERRCRRRPARQSHRADLWRGGRTRSVRFISEFARLGVDTRFVVDGRRYPTPVTFCEIFPPDDFPLYFYRLPKRAGPGDPPGRDGHRRRSLCQVFWATVTGLSEEPSRSAHSPRGRRAGGPPHGPRSRLPADVLGFARRGARAGAARTAARHRRGRQPGGVRDRRRRDQPAPRRRRSARPRRRAGHRQAGPAGRAGQDRGTRRECRPQRRRRRQRPRRGRCLRRRLCHGLLHGWPLEKTLRYANAAGAIVASRLECSTAMPTADEVAELADQTAVEAVNV